MNVLAREILQHVVDKMNGLTDKEKVELAKQIIVESFEEEDDKSCWNCKHRSKGFADDPCYECFRRLTDDGWEEEHIETSDPHGYFVYGTWEEIEVIKDAYDICGVKTWASKMKCDRCGFTTFAIERRFSQYNFCPSCGAKMDATLKKKIYV